ncbi:MAG: cellulase family glycosylhydrolase [Lachnospiraceae bacterium]|nr:cellulase family glycosylhydrolase [Lachnospiraceae bacterium]
MKKASKILLIILALIIIIGGNVAFYVIRAQKEKQVSQDENVSQSGEDIDTSSVGNDNVNGEADGSNGTDSDLTDTLNDSSEDDATDSGDNQSDSVSEEDFYADITMTGSWGENNSSGQYSVYLVNNSTLTVDGWTLTIEIGDGASVENLWGGEYSVADGVLTITPADYTKVVSAGGKAEIGFIASNVKKDITYVLESQNTYSAGTSSAGTNNNNGNSNNSNGGNGQAAVAANALEVPAPTTDDWLSVSGTDIVDSKGKKVWLTGVNWFGYNTGTNTFDGLWTSDLNTSIQGIADHGFNLIRVPISAELILQWKNGQAPMANFNQATNYYLVGMDSLEIWDYVVGQCRACGIKIMIDIHSAETNASGHNINMWTTSKISTAQYQEALVWMADRYKNDDTIIAYDLKNEPHGKPYEGSAAAIWNDSTAANNWKYVAETTALKVLEANPNVLIMVEGTEIYPIDITKNGDYHSTDDDDYYFNWWGGNLRGVADYPINLGKYQNKLVYSPHDYGPTVYQQPWFYSGYNYNSLMKDCWKDNWFYIYEDDIAPLLIGEWGGFMTEPNITWMTHMRTLIGNYHLNHTFWCFNANSGDTGGLVKDDFTTWDNEKYNFVKEVLWQENGKFIGLDHQIPLGPSGNGITLTEARGL